MSVFGVFGANATGKNAILKLVQRINPAFLVIKTSKVIMLSMGYSIDPFSDDKLPREWYLQLEKLSREEIREILDNKLRYFLRKFARDQTRIVATFHLALLKRNISGELDVYVEESKYWYKEVLSGAIYLRSDINSIFRRRRHDAIFGKDRGFFTRDEVGFQLRACDEAWNILAKEQFDGRIPYEVINNNDSENADEVAVKLKDFIDRIRWDKDGEINL